MVINRMINNRSSDDYKKMISATPIIINISKIYSVQPSFFNFCCMISIDLFFMVPHLYYAANILQVVNKVFHYHFHCCE